MLDRSGEPIDPVREGPLTENDTEEFEREKVRPAGKDEREITERDPRELSDPYEVVRQRC